MPVCPHHPLEQPSSGRSSHSRLTYVLTTKEKFHQTTSEVKREKRPYLNSLCRRGPRCLALFNESPPADGHDERDDTHQDNVLQHSLSSLGTPGIGQIPPFYNRFTFRQLFTVTDILPYGLAIRTTVSPDSRCSQ